MLAVPILGRLQAFLALVLQGILLVVVSLGLWNISYQYAYSFLLGGSISFLANGYFIYRFFRISGANALAKILANFVWGEFFKLLLIAALFLLIVRSVSIVPLVFLLGFIVAQLAFCLLTFVTFTFLGAKK